MRVAPAIMLTNAQRSELEQLSLNRRSEVRVSERARVILLAGSGLQNVEIARRLGVDRMTVALWRVRFVEWGVAGF